MTTPPPAVPARVVEKIRNYGSAQYYLGESTEERGVSVEEQCANARHVDAMHAELLAAIADAIEREYRAGVAVGAMGPIKGLQK